MKRNLSAWMIAMINIAAICNIKNFPLMAEYGLATIFFLVFSSIVFFIPSALVSAELATGWPERGVYTWVKEGLGPRWGFLAIWLQWIENVIWYPTILSFIAATFAYIFMPELAQNKFYVLAIVIVTFWAATFVNFYGIRVSGWISSISVICGTILPVILIICFGMAWIFGDHPVQIQFNWSAMLPDLGSVNQLVLLSGFLLGLAGMEMSAVHATDVPHPKRDYPKAILLSTILVIALSGLGSIAIAAVVPAKELELTSGGMEAFSSLFKAFGIPWAVPIIAAVITIGALGMMSTWIVGPSRGLHATAIDGDLPPFFHKTNDKGMPTSIFIVQGIIVTFLSAIFLFMPSVNTSYWILVAMASELYMIMYILMFIAAIRLRYTQPHKERHYHIPGGKLGMWLVAGIGILGSLFAIIIGFFPPSQIETGSLFSYEVTLIGITLFFCIIPIIIFSLRHAGWKKIH